LNDKIISSGADVIGIGRGFELQLQKQCVPFKNFMGIKILEIHISHPIPYSPVIYITDITCLQMIE
jgi:hypothetical protein